MQTFPNHLLLSEKPLICHQQVQLGLRNTERAFIKTLQRPKTLSPSIFQHLQTEQQWCDVLKCVHEDHGRVLSVGEVYPAVTEHLHFLQIKDKTLYSLPDKTAGGYIESQYPKHFKFSDSYIQFMSDQNSRL